MQCNIDARGRAVRLIGGIVMLVLAVVVGVLTLVDDLIGPAGWIGAGVIGFFGLVGIFEARAGWCAVRAMGFKTRL